MIRPACRLCGVKHWGNEPHVFDVANKVEQPRTMANSMANTLETMANSADAAPVTMANTYKYRDQAMRREYMRQYMAGRR